MKALYVVCLIFILSLSACDLFKFLPQPAKPTATQTTPGTPQPFLRTPKGGAVTPTLAKTLVPGRYRVQPLVTTAPFMPQAGSPRYLANFARLDKGCNWLGVAGQVFEFTQQPVINMVVVISGTLAGVPIDAIGLTGLATAYGPGGYEIVLADKVVNSSGTLKIQLFDLDGIPQTDPVVLNTLADCQKNLVIFNFLQIPGPYRDFFPWIGR